MLRDIDDIAIHLPYDKNAEPMGSDEEGWISEGLVDYLSTWEEVLQPALGEVELLASPSVAELADRVSSALMEGRPTSSCAGPSRTTTPPGSFQTRELKEVLRNAMRVELGLPSTSADQCMQARRDRDWPWLPDRPSRESYVQSHPPSAD